MTAIILAAGRGSRLGPVTAHVPKCLLRIDRRTLLDRTLDRVGRAGIRKATVVTGFEAAQIERAVAARAPRDLRVRLVHNPRYVDTNNLYSLALALDQVNGPFTVINGDDFFNVRILEALQTGGTAAAAAIDFTRPLAHDAMRAVIQSNRVVALGKTVPAERAAGNAIGLYRFSGESAARLQDEVTARVSQGLVNSFYVAAIDALAARLPIGAVSTESLTWGEIDDARDLAAAPDKVRRIEAEETAADARERHGPQQTGAREPAIPELIRCPDRAPWYHPDAMATA